eukprot:Pgem_evm1s9155
MVLNKKIFEFPPNIRLTAHRIHKKQRTQIPATPNNTNSKYNTNNIKSYKQHKKQEQELRRSFTAASINTLNSILSKHSVSFSDAEDDIINDYLVDIEESEDY